MLDLERELVRGWGAVRLSSPSDCWDLSVSVGPVMSYRITTAVVWNWQPMWAGRATSHLPARHDRSLCRDRPGPAIGRSSARPARFRCGRSVVPSAESSRGNCRE
jgi:hypothetical protein